MLCYGTQYIYHTNTKDGMACYTFTIMRTLPLPSFYPSQQITKHDTKHVTKHITSRKTVSFNCCKNSICYVPSKYEEDRSIGFEIPRGLAEKWDNSQQQIACILNNNLQNRICELSELETSIKIMDLTKEQGWWEDCSPLEFLDKLTTGKLNLSDLVSEIDTLINQTVAFKKTANIQLTYQNYKIDIRKALNTHTNK